MPKSIRFNAFSTPAPGSQASTLWNYPGNQAAKYNTLKYWKDLAHILERGLFDSIFLADFLGVMEVYGGSPAAALKHAVSVPIMDPLQLVVALADATTDIGFGMTVNLSAEPPHIFARRMSTLDHLTEGRIGWNIVTGILESASKAVGESGTVRHDERYDIAEEYMRSSIACGRAAGKTTLPAATR